MNFMKKALVLLFLTGCAGQARQCASCNADSYGADWVVVQYRTDGMPLNCWKLRSVSIGQETGDSIVWQSSDGHLVHIAGWYNRVQVHDGDYEGAAKAVGVDLHRCTNGAYAPLPIPSSVMGSGGKVEVP